MTKRRTPAPRVPSKADDKEQSRRFIETSVEYGADDEDAFEETFKKAVPPKAGARPSSKR